MVDKNTSALLRHGSGKVELAQSKVWRGWFSDVSRYHSFGRPARKNTFIALCNQLVKAIPLKAWGWSRSTVVCFCITTAQPDVPHLCPSVPPSWFGSNYCLPVFRGLTLKIISVTTMPKELLNRAVTGCRFRIESLRGRRTSLPGCTFRINLINSPANLKNRPPGGGTRFSTERSVTKHRTFPRFKILSRLFPLRD